jgi:hypothetical protein
MMKEIVSHARRSPVTPESSVVVGVFSREAAT